MPSRIAIRSVTRARARGRGRAPGSRQVALERRERRPRLRAQRRRGHVATCAGAGRPGEATVHSSASEPKPLRMKSRRDHASAGRTEARHLTFNVLAGRGALVAHRVDRGAGERSTCPACAGSGAQHERARAGGDLQPSRDGRPAALARSVIRDRRGSESQKRSLRAAETRLTLTLCSRGASVSLAAALPGAGVVMWSSGVASRRRAWWSRTSASRWAPVVSVGSSVGGRRRRLDRRRPRPMIVPSMPACAWQTNS